MESRTRRLLGRTAGVALIMFVALGVPSVASAGDDYAIQTQTGQAIVPGTADIGNHCDDCVTQVALPFQVPVYGAPYSSAYVSSNGNIQFLTDNGGHPFLACTPLAINGFDRAFIPYLADLSTEGAGNGIFTATIGSPPNRQFVIEWRTSYFQRAGSANFEVMLTEGSGTLSVIYGVNTDNGSQETSGIQSSDAGPFTQFSCGETTLVSGLRVNYVPGGPPPPPPPPPPARCRVPRVIGLRLGQARQRIRRARCSVGRVRRVRTRRSLRGRVVRQTPRPGAIRRRGFPVNLVVGRR
jgi:hypothetical protein